MRLGYIAFKIKYDDIKSITIEDGWGTSSSMALSRHRVKIQVHNKGKILGTTYISPENREMFVMELTHRCKNLENKKEYF